MIDRLCAKCQKRLMMLEELVITKEYLLPTVKEQQLDERLWKVLSNLGKGWPYVRSERSLVYTLPLLEKDKDYFKTLRELKDSALVQLRVLVVKSMQKGIQIEVTYIPALYRKITQSVKQDITLDALSACHLEARMLYKTVFESGLGAIELGQESDSSIERILEKLNEREWTNVAEPDRIRIRNQISHALDSFRDKRYSDFITRINNICEILILSLFHSRQAELGKEEGKIESLSRRDAHTSRLGVLKEKILGDRLWHDLFAIHLRRRESDSVHGLGKPMTQSDAILVAYIFEGIVYDIEEKIPPT